MCGFSQSKRERRAISPGAVGSYIGMSFLESGIFEQSYKTIVRVYLIPSESQFTCTRLMWSFSPTMKATPQEVAFPLTPTHGPY